MEFLRANVAEVTRTGLSNRHTNTSETFSGDDAETSFTMTNTKLLCVNSVSIGGTPQEKYLNYDIDLTNSKIVFASPPAAGSNNISVDYDFNTGGASWIYADGPRDSLSETSYPRIGVEIITNPAVQMGQNETDRWHTVSFQMDVRAFKGQMCTISGEQREGVTVARYIANQVVNKIFTQESNIKTKLTNPNLLENRPLGIEEPVNVFRRTVTVSLEGKNLGD